VSDDGWTAVVITVSTRAAAGVYADRSGPVIVEALRELGFAVQGPVVVADGPGVTEALRTAIAAGPAVIITSGGTGLNPNDRTPELTRRLLDKEIPALALAIASFGVAQGVPTAVLSRGLAGTAGRSVVVNLPGSTGGAKDGMAVLGPVLAHAVSQLRGGDH
jgi:molybdenum cofactor synthesis domain-containing protein